MARVDQHPGGAESNIDTAVGVGEGAHNHGRPNGQDMSSA
jgi:hypothetical protein